MTVEEAIDEIELYMDEAMTEEQEQALEVALEALGRRVPAPVVEDNSRPQCPVCKVAVRQIYKYCQRCGQKLDFGDRKDDEDEIRVSRFWFEGQLLSD